MENNIEDIEKYNRVKSRIKMFESVKTIDEARALAKKIMPISRDITIFKVGFAKCIIINKPNFFRVSLNSSKEYISYNFEKLK